MEINEYRIIAYANDFASNRITFRFLNLPNYLGNPCVRPERIPSQAPEVHCENGDLVGATKSDNGYIVIGMLQSREFQRSRGYYEASMISNRCQNRARQGYRSGMGRIFIEVASINPIVYRP